MAKLVSKGTVLDQDIASTLTPIAQIISMDISGTETQTFDSTTLDTSGAGQETDVTGYVDGGELSFELFLDPALGGHQNLTDLITTPIVESWSIEFSDSSEWLFSGVLSGPDVTVAQDNGVVASFSVELDQLFSYLT